MARGDDVSVVMAEKPMARSVSVSSVVPVGSQAASRQGKMIPQHPMVTVFVFVGLMSFTGFIC